MADLESMVNDDDDAAVEIKQAKKQALDPIFSCHLIPSDNSGDLTNPVVHVIVPMNWPS